jgi:hypothetical protein
VETRPSDRKEEPVKEHDDRSNTGQDKADERRDELEDLDVAEQQAEDVRGGAKKLRGRGRGEP